MRGNETPKRIVTNFCTGVGVGLWVYDVITSANFYDYRLRYLGVAGVKFCTSIDLRRRPYNTLAQPCERVTWKLSYWSNRRALRRYNYIN